MSEKPLSAETPNEQLRSWVTANSMFFSRNQGEIMREPIPLSEWELIGEGEVKKALRFNFDQVIRMPKAIVANTIECSGNGRSLLKEKASGNPWTTGGVGNAVWGGVWLKDVLEKAGLKASAKHVAFEGLDEPLGSSGIKFIRSIPVEKAMSSTILAYEMNGEPLPLEHGYPVRTVALGWTGANCAKWVHRIKVLAEPFQGHYMDKVYRVFQKGEDPESGTIVTRLNLKSFITQPLQDESLPAGPITLLGVAYAGEANVKRIEVSVDHGKTWNPATFIGPHERFAWRQWQYVWVVKKRGDYTLLSRATGSDGRQQPLNGHWNVLGYGNNGIVEHAVTVHVR
ncbi:MAG: molybdopterin-dependent oxidoreductase [Proteobacteria bacterium]|nr:molybdopterin-dependent oxidoreductase [Pseudomonadota bacterium]